MKRAVAIVALLHLIVSTASAQTQPEHTTFQGLWIGMSAAEFGATEKGKPLVDKYEHSRFRFQPSWQKLCDPNTTQDVAGKIMPASVTLRDDRAAYTIEKAKLTSIFLTTSDSFETTSGFLTERFGEPTTNKVIPVQNGFGATWNVYLARWDRPDNVRITVKGSDKLNEPASVHYEIPEQEAPKVNPY